MTDPPAPIPFLDVDSLIDESQPRGRVGWFWYALGTFFLMVLLSTYASTQSDEGARLVGLLSSFGMLGLVVAMVFVTGLAARAVRAEQQQIEAIEELIQLRRWSDAAVLVEALLSKPTRTPPARFQGLVFLAAVLARFHRFPDAIRVYDHLLEHDWLDGSTTHALRLGRAMSLLRDDRLFDADRAIGELRRTGDGDPSAGLALVEIYRDVKTGHPDEAIDLFSEQLGVMRRKLGVRIADAYALVARAFDLVGRGDEAAAAYRDATTLAPESELQRRYPELAALAGKYAPAAVPAEVA